MASTSNSQIQVLMASIKGLWDNFDELFDSMKPEDWSRMHGADWTFADVPYHVAYFDRNPVVKAIERGPDVPQEDRRVMRTLQELNAWNVDRFAERAAGQTPEQSMQQMRAVRQAMQNLLSTMSDEDLNRPIWFPLPGGGWLTVMFALMGCVAHTWSEFIQLRYHMERATPEPSAEATHATMSVLTGFFPVALDRKQAANTQFTALLEFTGPGGGAWTIRVADGSCTVMEERAGKADLVMTQSPETFELIRQTKLDPMGAIQGGQLKVDGMEHMQTFGALFPPPDIDREIEPMAPLTRG